jgi:hypothetical protein
VRQCRDCQTTWYLGEVEREYYASRGLCEPVRCRPCRDVRRAAAGRRA